MGAQAASLAVRFVAADLLFAGALVWVLACGVKEAS
jgi:hypothetical protein